MNQFPTIDSDLRVFITHFVPPKRNVATLLRDFFLPRFSQAYVRSWARLIRHGTRGNQPWKKDVMTKVRRKDQINKLRYLCNQILILKQIQLNSLEIYVHTNSVSVAHQLRNIFRDKEVFIKEYPQYNRMNQLHNSPWKFNDRSSPWFLAWEHKLTFKEVFERSEKKALFLCLEDDTLFTSGNLEYFLKYKDSLQKFNLLPSFLQVEFHNHLGQYFAVGNFANQKISTLGLARVKLMDQVFVQLPNPYSGIILLDYQQALEYVNSDAFNEETSRKLSWWDIGARAAMGLQFVNPPEGFSSRNVLPLNKDGTGIALDAWVIHQPNIYVEKREVFPGLTPDSLFAS